MFRKVALDRLSSPEELDQLPRVTSPRSWLALLALGILLAVALAWSGFATIPITVTGRGVLAPGDPAGPPLQAILFVAPDDGARLQPGLPVQLAPGPIRPEAYGLLLGTVRSVAARPVTQRELAADLGNDAFAQTLAAAGQIVAVRVDLLPDPGTPSGYRWAAGAGPPLQLQAGMISEGRITVGEQRPINLVIPP